MGRYRILQRPSYINPSIPIFEVQVKDWWSWKHAGICLTVKEAEERIAQLRHARLNPVETKVIRECD